VPKEKFLFPAKNEKAAFLNWINIVTGCLSVDERVVFTILIFPDPAETPLFIS